MNSFRLAVLLLTLNAVTTQADTAYKNSEEVPTNIEIRELTADEDPLSADKVERDLKLKEETTKETSRSFNPELYGSLRVRYRKQSDDGAWEDGSSRLGINLDKRILESSSFLARYEAGFNVLDRLDSSISTDEFKESVFERLGYIGLSTPSADTIFGKNWSTYYQIASFTDRFMGAGGDAAGVFNAQSDGGSTGTGRADNVLQTSLPLDFLPQRLFKPFELNVQIQHGNDIPYGNGAQYGTAIGLSSIVTTHNNFTVGLAYNYANVDLDDDPVLRSIGLNGSSQALLVGTRKYGERWYGGMVIARMENHETTDQGIYFDGWGSEFYGQYQLFDKLWLVGGYNLLEPDSGQSQSGDYRVRYALAGMRYSFDDFKRMIFANVRINDGLNADGSAPSDIYTIGIKWDFSFSRSRNQ
jgi:predicted porin